MVQPALLAKLETLPESPQTEILHYEFLSERYLKTEIKTLELNKKRSVLGILKVKI